MKRILLFAMSGSFGDLMPDFLQQMRMAMSGYRSAIKNQGCDKEQDDAYKKSGLSLEKSLPWSAVSNTFCLWPSHETVLTMKALRGSVTVFNLDVKEKDITWYNKYKPIRRNNIFLRKL